MYKLDKDKVFFTSDTHFNHEKIIEYCKRPFSSVEEMDKKLVSNWNEVVSEGCTVFHLGGYKKSTEWTYNPNTWKS